MRSRKPERQRRFQALKNILWTAWLPDDDAAKREQVLRRIEVVRAVVPASAIENAAALRGVSAGIPQPVKHTDRTLDLWLFTRKGGLFVLAFEATRNLVMLHHIHQQAENLETAPSLLKTDGSVRPGFASPGRAGLAARAFPPYSSASASWRPGKRPTTCCGDRASSSACPWPSRTRPQSPTPPRWTPSCRSAAAERGEDPDRT